MPTQLQQSVWEALKLIPRGRITTYGALANYLNTKAIRSVATAVGKNPNAPHVPCHRVVLSTKKVGKYSAPGGRATKTTLLKKEGLKIKNNIIDNFDAVFFDFDK